MEISTIGNSSITNFHSSYRTIDWKKIIEDANVSLEIVVYYWDAWTNHYFQELTSFLTKSDSVIKFFFVDINNPVLASQILNLFPSNKSIEQLNQKIINTYKPLQDFCQQNNLPLHKVQVYTLSQMLGYALQVIDSKLAVISIFEMYRCVEQIDAPAILVNLSEDTIVHSFFAKEINAMTNNTQINI